MTLDIYVNQQKIVIRRTDACLSHNCVKQPQRIRCWELATMRSHGLEERTVEKLHVTKKDDKSFCKMSFSSQGGIAQHLPG